MARRWDTAFNRNNLTTFSGTADLLQGHKVAPIIGWETAVIIMEQWAVFLEVILGPLG